MGEKGLGLAQRAMYAVLMSWNLTMTGSDYRRHIVSRLWQQQWGWKEG